MGTMTPGDSGSQFSDIPIVEHSNELASLRGLGAEGLPSHDVLATLRNNPGSWLGPRQSIDARRNVLIAPPTANYVQTGTRSDKSMMLAFGRA